MFSTKSYEVLLRSSHNNKLTNVSLFMNKRLSHSFSLFIKSKQLLGEHLKLQFCSAYKRMMIWHIICNNKFRIKLIHILLEKCNQMSTYLNISESVKSTVHKAIYLSSCSFKSSNLVSFSFSAFSNVFIVCSVSVLYFCKLVHLFRRASIL